MSIPLLYYNIPFGHWYGIRFPETLKKKDLWDKVNKYAGKILLIQSLTIIFFALVLNTLFKVDIFSYIMSIYIYFSAVFFYKRINGFIKKQNNL